LIIRELYTDDEREQMYRLVHDEYVGAGYIDPRPDKRFVHYKGLWDNISQTVTHLAYDDIGDLIGTNSLTRDSDTGIHTGIDFPKETMRERLTGKSLASSWRIVTRSDQRNSAGLICALIRATIQTMVTRGVETSLFTFNPKHMCRYHLALNMEMIGFNESTQGLHGAPAVLMRAYTKDYPERWLR
jgi:hypothetical protein